MTRRTITLIPGGIVLSVDQSLQDRSDDLPHGDDPQLPVEMIVDGDRAAPLNSPFHNRSE